MSKFKGTGIALITPFKGDFSVDIESLKSLVEYNVQGGVDFLVVLGTTAETATLTKVEQEMVIHTIVEANAGRLPVALGVGGNNTRSVCNEIKTADLNGIDGILSVSPYYNRPSQEGVYQHFKAISEESPLPIIAYNVPSRTGSNISVETTLRIARDFKNIVAIKEASGNINQAMEIFKDKPEDFILLSGDDNLTVPMMNMGGDGVISVSAQAYPAKFKEMMNGDLATRNRVHYELYDFTNLLFAEGNPAGIKSALKTMGVIQSSTVRLPLVEATEGLQKAIKEEISRIS